MSVKKHQHEIHKYQRVDLGSSYGKKQHFVFRCMLPNCSHYLPQLALAEGKKTYCWRCDKECVMTREMVGRVKPVCRNCKKSKKDNPIIDADMVEKFAKMNIGMLPMASKEKE